MAESPPRHALWRLAAALVAAAMALPAGATAPLGVSFLAERRDGADGLSLGLPIANRDSLHGVGVALLLQTFSENSAGLMVAPLLNVAAGFSGVQAAGFANVADDVVPGAQLAFCANRAERLAGAQIAVFLNSAETLRGVQLAGGFNEADPPGPDRVSSGVQLALLGNRSASGRPEEAEELWGALLAARDDGGPASRFRGLQGAVGFNAAADLAGAQLALGANFARRCDGLQAGLVNRAGRLCGVQIGLWNRALSGTGVQIGLVNGFGPEGDALWLPLVNARF